MRAMESFLRRRREVMAVLVLVVAGVTAYGAAGWPGIGGATGTPGRSGAPAAAPASAGRTTVQLGNITTYHDNNGRTGYDGLDPSLATLTGAWDDSNGSRALDGAVYAEPLVYHGLVVVATENDSVYGIDARTGAVRWRFHFGSPASQSSIQSTPGCGDGGDIFPLGVTSTPVIDRSLDEVFVAGEVQAPGTNNWTGLQHWLVGASIRNGRILFRHRIDPPGANTASTYYVGDEQQRAGLTLANGRVYVPYGGLDGDCGQYHGYVVSVSESGAGRLGVYQVPTQREGAIWETNGAVAGPGSKADLYVATGNGSATGPPFDHGDAVIRLSPDLKELGYWAPTDWAQLNADDLDLGSAGPIQVPRTDLLFEIGKADPNGVSVGYLLSETHLGHIGGQLFPPNGHLAEGTVCQAGGYVFGANAAAVVGRGASAKTYIYVACSTGTEAIVVTGGPHPSFKRAWHVNGGDFANGPPLVAGGRVWAIDWDNNILVGMRMTTGKVVVSENLDQVEHFATPAVGDGMLFVPTAGGVEAFYGPSGLPLAAPTKIAVKVNPASPRAGKSIVVTATISPDPLGGLVRMSEGGKPIAGCTAMLPSVSGSVDCQLSKLTVGEKTVVVHYFGNPAYSPATKVVHFTVTT
jgi:outer membrane protein assembly factor BamB